MCLYARGEGGFISRKAIIITLKKNENDCFVCTEIQAIFKQPKQFGLNNGLDACAIAIGIYELSTST